MEYTDYNANFHKYCKNPISQLDSTDEMEVEDNTIVSEIES